MAYEYSNIVYDTESEKLAKCLEAIRQRQKQDNPFRIKISWVSREFKPSLGYISNTEYKRLTEYDKEVAFPLLAYNRVSRRGPIIYPGLIDTIGFSDSKLAEKHGPIYQRTNQYYNKLVTDWINAAHFP